MGKLAELIGNRLREVKKDRGLRQEDLERFGISYKYYQRIEGGKVNPTLETIEKIAEAFDCKPEELFMFPMTESQEREEIQARLAECEKQGDSEALRKLLVIIREVL
ncbi:helix-turn-helix domain-containing protein [Dethiosulfatarculus sandiegensis]|uniref:DNA-binding protein n=1 Tax=Dethiosulfatarculus sandiegensis TaxID=1429043 RepID=A0A0D2HQ90_9BACT|nr:helix-turn-helix transcriptional regulator [Dethiosulfatarculus sandiegensis]KIX12643.1 DNA-binding protein [Dethiosulfatarculus sandiegensis]